MIIENRKLTDIIPYDNNPKLHQVEWIINSIKIGLPDGLSNEERRQHIVNTLIDQPIVVDGDGVIIKGHGRLKAAQELGLTTFPVVVRTDLTSEQVRLARIADNRSQDGGWESDRLQQELSDIMDQLPEVDFDGLGIDEDWFADLDISFDDPLSESDDTLLDTLPPEPVNVVIQPGDLIEFPNGHRLICGDCRDWHTWERFLNGQQVHGVITSPPYAEQRKEHYNSVPVEKYVDWWDAVQANVQQALTEDGSFFVNLKAHCEDGQRVLYVMDLVLAMVRQWGWRFVDEFCWVKPGYPGDFDRRFKNGFEPIYHFARCAEFRAFLDQVAEGRASSVNATWEPLSKTQGTEGTVKGLSVNSVRPSNVLEIAFDQTGVADSHSARFPVKLPAFFIQAFSRSGDRWCDPFCGSGSTLIAAIRSGRIGYGIELDPQSVQWSVERVLKELNEETCIMNGESVDWNEYRNKA